MQGEFEISMMGELKYFLELQIKQKDEGIYISQQKYIRDLFKKFDVQDCKLVATPMSGSLSLDKDELGKAMDNKLYRSMIRSLLYLTTSRPDIMFSICLYASFNPILRSLISKQSREYLGILKDHQI